jgi:ubiquinone/menaquinone biosynthesis C-methylase UbiE
MMSRIQNVHYSIPLPRKFVDFLRGKELSSILDLGCGYGRACFFLNENHYDVVGIDVDRAQIEMALDEKKTRYKNARISFLICDARKLGFSSSTFDGCILMGTLNLVSKVDRHEVIQEIYRILKPSGYLFIEEFGQTWENPVYSKRYREDLSITDEIGTFTVKDDSGKILFFSHHFTQKELSTLLKDFNIIIFEDDVFTSCYHGNWVKGYYLIAQK